MKKIIFFGILLSITIYCLAQKPLTESTLNQRMPNVSKIVERNRNQCFLSHCSKWTERYFYNENGFLIRQINLENGKKRGDYQYDYFFFDTLLIITQLLNNDSINCLYFNFSFDSLKNYTLFEMYSARDLCVPSVTGNNFIYKDSLLVSYYRNDSKIQFYYDSLGRIIQMIYIDRDSTHQIIYTSIYDNFGRETDYIKESPNDVLVGIPFWSRDRKDKAHIRYSNFDKYGNWRTSYFIIEKGEVFRSKRKIKYNRTCRYP